MESGKHKIKKVLSNIRTLNLTIDHALTSLRDETSLLARRTWCIGQDLKKNKGAIRNVYESLQSIYLRGRNVLSLFG
jgi:hypothetical protein